MKSENKLDEKYGRLVEGLDARVAEVLYHYIQQMEGHPLGGILSDSPPRSLLEEYARVQYMDSVLWVPMLAIMKDRARNPSLIQALRDNLLCEAGARQPSHVSLCQSFIRSLGISPIFGSPSESPSVALHSLELMNGVSGMSEAQIAGYNLVSEAVVPELFKMALEAFQAIPGSDSLYLAEHITVDIDHHTRDMIAAVNELLKETASDSVLVHILHGMHMSGRAALSVPDVLFAKYLRGAYGEPR